MKDPRLSTHRPSPNHAQQRTAAPAFSCGGSAPGSTGSVTVAAGSGLDALFSSDWFGVFIEFSCVRGLQLPRLRLAPLRAQVAVPGCGR